MIVAIIAVLIGLLLIGAGGYYFIKEKSDKESRKIYMITMLIGVIIVIGALVKFFCLGNTYQKSPIPQWLRDRANCLRCNLRDFPDKVIHDPDFLHLLAVHLLDLADQDFADKPFSTDSSSSSMAA